MVTISYGDGAVCVLELTFEQRQIPEASVLIIAFCHNEIVCPITPHTLAFKITTCVEKNTITCCTFWKVKERENGFLMGKVLLCVCLSY